MTRSLTQFERAYALEDWMRERIEFCENAPSIKDIRLAALQDPRIDKVSRGLLESAFERCGVRRKRKSTELELIQEELARLTVRVAQLESPGPFVQKPLPTFDKGPTCSTPPTNGNGSPRKRVQNVDRCE